MQLDFVYKVYQIYKQNYSDKKKLIAVSFGQDSTTLLFILFYIQQTIKQPMYLIHCNHFSQLSNFNTIKEGFKISYLVNSNLIISCPITNPRTETKQRLWRHRIFKRSMNLLNINSLYLGHTKTDRIETFLFNLFRGSSLTALSNFNSENKYFDHECFKNPTKQGKLYLNKVYKIKYVRPLLDMSRQHIKNLVKNNKIPNLIDFSNFNTKFTRNKIRLLLLPLLKLYFNNNIETQIERLLIQSELDQLYFGNQISKLKTKEIPITKSEFKKLPKAVQYRFLKELITSYTDKQVNFAIIQKLQRKI